MQAVRLCRAKTIGQLLPNNIHHMGVLILVVVVALAAACKKGHEEDRGDKDIHPDGVQVGHPAAGDVFPGKEAGAEDQVFYGDEEFAVEMGKVFEEMADQMAKAFFWLQVLLAATGAKTFLYNGTAVQAGLVVAEMMTAHGIFSKNIEKSGPLVGLPYTGNDLPGICDSRSWNRACRAGPLLPLSRREMCRTDPSHPFADSCTDNSPHNRDTSRIRVRYCPRRR